MKAKKYMAIDIGAASGRAIVGYLEQNRLMIKEIHRFETGDIFLINARVRNVQYWYGEILNALKQYSFIFGSELYSIGTDSMGEDFVLLDRSGGILRVPPSYRDLKCDKRVIAREESLYGNERLYEICGNQSVSNDTLRQLISLSLYEAEVLERTDGLLYLGDFFHYLLCGSRSVEHSLASYGKLYNQREQCFEDSIFSSFHIPEALKGSITLCGEELGDIHREIGRDTGIKSGTRVISPCTHDTACAAFAVPADGNEWAFISSGSWSIAGIATDYPVINKRAWKFNCSNSSMPFGKNMFKKLIAGMWIIQRCSREWGIRSFSQIVSKAQSVRENRFYFDPDLPELYNPSSMTKQLCRIIRQNYGTAIDPRDVGFIACICFESLALKYRYTLDEISRITDRRIREIYIVGGGSRNNLLNQMTANACGYPVITGIEEASAVGNLLCQMAGSGEIALCDRAELLKNSFPLSVYEPAEKELWEEKYDSYIKICRLRQG